MAAGDTPIATNAGGGLDAIRRTIEGAPQVARPDVRTGDAFNQELGQYDLNDRGNGKRFVARHGADILYVKESGWHVWDGFRWKREGVKSPTVRAKAHQTGESILEECQAVQRADVDKWPGGKSSRDALAADLFAWSKSSGDRRRIEAMISEAEPYLTVDPSVLDADPMMINLANGTMRLEGACDTLRPHAREDRLTKLMPVDFVPEAACPNWLTFLNKVQPDRRTQVLLQIFGGYCLTGLTTEQKIIFNYGEGGNGKSVFVDMLARLMGAYAVSLPFAAMARDDHERPGEASPHLARLPGARMVRASEPERGVHLAEARVKALTGGEEVTARHLNQGFFDFKPQFKIMLSGNHKPVVRGQDRGIWRRLILVPWLVNLPESEQDEELPEKLWAERSGILNWFLDGARMWLERGLEIPDNVRQATDGYRSDSDPLGRFITACIVPSEGSSVTGREMFDAYRKWCIANGEHVWTQSAFGRTLPERGIAKDTSGARVLYLNVHLDNVPNAGSVDAADEPPPPAGPEDYGGQPS